MTANRGQRWSSAPDGAVSRLSRTLTIKSLSPQLHNIANLGTINPHSDVQPFESHGVASSKKTIALRHTPEASSPKPSISPRGNQPFESHGVYTPNKDNPSQTLDFYVKSMLVRWRQIFRE